VYLQLYLLLCACFRVQLPLSSVRPFMWDNISLAAVAPPLDPEDTAALTAVLERKVRGGGEGEQRGWRFWGGGRECGGVCF